jgi:hypothetical protein
MRPLTTHKCAPLTMRSIFARSSVTGFGSIAELQPLERTPIHTEITWFRRYLMTLKATL